MTELSEIYDIVRRNRGAAQIREDRPTVREHFMSNLIYNSPLVGILPTTSHTQTVQDMTQNNEILLTHPGNKLSSKQVFVSELDVGPNTADTSLDFDLIDESKFAQENTSVGTDFIDGKVSLRVNSTDNIPSSFDPARTDSSAVLSNNNKTIAHVTAYITGRPFGDSVSSGKHYWEVRVDANSYAALIGIYDQAYIGGGPLDGRPTTHIGNPSAWNSIGYYYNGETIKCTSGIQTREDYAATYTVGDIIGVALDCDANTVKFSKNNVWGPAKTITAGRSYFPGISSGASAADLTYTARFDPLDMSYNLSGYTRGHFTSINRYASDQPYYITTTDQNNFNLSTVMNITSVIIINTQPVNTSIKALISFDGRTTWSKWDGFSWTTHIGGLTNLQTGNTITELGIWFY